jgi:hypothetical protein
MQAGQTIRGAIEKIDKIELMAHQPMGFGRNQGWARIIGGGIKDKNYIAKNIHAQERETIGIEKALFLFEKKYADNGQKIAGVKKHRLRNKRHCGIKPGFAHRSGGKKVPTVGGEVHDNY